MSGGGYTNTYTGGGGYTYTNGSPRTGDRGVTAALVIFGISAVIAAGAIISKKKKDK